MSTIGHFIHRAKHYLDPRTAYQSIRTQTQRAAAFTQRSFHQQVNEVGRIHNAEVDYAKASSRSITQEFADVTVRIEKVVVPIIAFAAAILTSWIGGLGGVAVAWLGAANAEIAGRVEARRRGEHGQEANQFARHQAHEVLTYASVAAGVGSLVSGIYTLVAGGAATAAEGGASGAEELAGEAGHVNEVAAGSEEALQAGTAGTTPEIEALANQEAIPSAGWSDAPIPEATPEQAVHGTIAAGANVPAAGTSWWEKALGWGEKLIGPGLKLLEKGPKPPNYGGSFQPYLPGGSSGAGAPPVGAPDDGGGLLDDFKKLPPIIQALLSVGGAVAAGVLIHALTKEKKHGV